MWQYLVKQESSQRNLPQLTVFVRGRWIGVFHDSPFPGTMTLISGDSASQLGADVDSEKPQEREWTWQWGGLSGLFQDGCQPLA